MLWFKEKKKEKEKGLTRGIYHYLYPRGKKQKSRIDEMGDQSWDFSKKNTSSIVMGYKICIESFVAI